MTDDVSHEHTVRPAIEPFIMATRELQVLRSDHAPAIKKHRDAKAAAQQALHNSMDACNVTCVTAGGGQYARIKTNRSIRALTDKVIHTALDAVPDDVLTGNSIDDAADAISAEVQRARTVQRKYVAFDKAVERGCDAVENPLVAEHATAYARATAAFKAAGAELKTAIGDRPAQLREHAAAAAAWLGEHGTQKLTLNGGGHSANPNSEFTLRQTRRPSARPEGHHRGAGGHDPQGAATRPKGRRERPGCARDSGAGAPTPACCSALRAEHPRLPGSEENLIRKSPSLFNGTIGGNPFWWRYQHACTNVNAPLQP